MNELTGTIEMPLRGLTGKEGLSAYEVACKHGFTGTEEEWLETIVTKEAFEKVENDARDVIVVESDRVIYLNKNTRELVVRGNGACVDVVVPEDCHIGWRCVINLAEIENTGRFDAGFDYPSLMFGSDATWKAVEAGKVYTLVRVNKKGNPNDFALFELDNITRHTEDEQAVVEKAHSHDNITILNSVTEEKVNEWGKKISEERGAELFANVLKGRKAGAVVRLDDISPLKHAVKCVVRGEAVHVKGYGKNLSDIMRKATNGVITLSYGRANAGQSYGWSNPDKDNVLMSAGTYTVSCDYENVGTTYSKASIYAYEYGDKTYTKLGSSQSTEKSGHLSFTMTLTEGKYIRLVLQNNAGQTVYEDGEVAVNFSNVQVEAGYGDTGYVPYVEPVEYFVGEDGKVDGLISSEMTLMSDTEGAVLECEYNRDINKAFEEMCNAIISLGGNV
ncbi:MAG: hypothetical protein IJO83_03085 [Clostridia bacterium]|nr:hypothetical protein [Clostridia bacterium]